MENMTEAMPYSEDEIVAFELGQNGDVSVARLVATIRAYQDDVLRERVALEQALAERSIR